MGFGNVQGYVEWPRKHATGHNHWLWHCTDKNSVAKMFPSSPTLLSKYHITKNVRSRVKHVVGLKQVKHDDGKLVKPGVVVENIMDAWNSIINSSTEKLYAKFILHFMSVYTIYPDFLKYVVGTILDQVKEKIFCVWTNQVQNFGNTITNRVGLAHARLKNWLGNSKGDFCRDWDVVNQMLWNQHNEIQMTFGYNIKLIQR